MLGNNDLQDRWISRYFRLAIANMLVDLLQKCFLQEVGKGKRLKGKVGSQEGDKGRGKIQNLSPFSRLLQEV